MTMNVFQNWIIIINRKKALFLPTNLQIRYHFKIKILTNKI